MEVTPERMSELLGIARTEAERSGRSPDPIEVTYLGAPNSVEIDVADWAGVDRYIVMDRTADFTREPERLIALAAPLGVALALPPRPGG
jgi:hypothetical protein